jgi:hypothetical protein
LVQYYKKCAYYLNLFDFLSNDKIGFAKRLNELHFALLEADLVARFLGAFLHLDSFTFHLQRGPPHRSGVGIKGQMERG